ncbi:COP9 signalosome complex subunit 7a isoform X2 [Oncorhynchus kisutch]|uniref:COP9 signalosome subunit 7A n=1 Tax=Oncorhynchus kisutch TaxID=8019 RepID=A0A8C7HRV5_ONCKI|nr:COP9 signalosome complex subunit 7a isoform X2 [Oncorhynchus kisutch]
MRRLTHTLKIFFIVFPSVIQQAAAVSAWTEPVRFFVGMFPCHNVSPFCCSFAVSFFSLSVCGMLILSERAASLPELTPAQRNKLRHLSIISLASNLKCLPYSLLLQQLELKNVRELEDLLIEAVYCDIIQGKLDQRNQQVEVDCSVGRDLGPNELPNIANTLQEWCSGCEAVLCGIEEQVTRANQYRESQLKVKVQVETEVSNLQKTLKASSASPSSGPAAAGAASNQDADQPAEPRDPASSQEPRQPGKKSSKVKGLRGSGKIWSKSN